MVPALPAGRKTTIMERLIATGKVKNGAVEIAPVPPEPHVAARTKLEQELQRHLADSGDMVYVMALADFYAGSEAGHAVNQVLTRLHDETVGRIHALRRIDLWGTAP